MLTVPLPVARFLRGGVPAAGVVGVVDGRAVDDVKCEGLSALGWVDDEEDLIESSRKRSLVRYRTTSSSALWRWSHSFSYLMKRLSPSFFMVASSSSSLSIRVFKFS